MDAIKSGRQFALSFDADEYGKPLSDAVAYFVHRILLPSDQLLVRSPLRIYKLNSNASKEELLERIASILKTDIPGQRGEKSDELNALNNLIKNIEPQLDASKNSLSAIEFFTRYFNTQWRTFYSEFVLSNMEQFNEIASQLNMENPTGDKWLIHFHQNESTPLHERFKRICTKIKDSFARMTDKKVKEKLPALLDKLDHTEKLFDMASHIPVDSLTNNFLAANINFNVVFLPSASETQSLTEINYGLNETFNALAMRTGGCSIHSTNPTEALTTVNTHTDSYYDLIFPFDGIIEDKTIDIHVPPSSGEVYYKNKFGKDELNAMMAALAPQNLFISGYDLQNHGLTFTVSGYGPSTPGNSAFPSIHVTIQLINDQQTVVYQTGNVLKPKNDAIAVSVTIPAEYSGYFKLLIVAREPQSGKTCEWKQFVKI